LPRILVADDHSLMRRRVRELLESQDGWEVCAEAATGREAVALAATKQPDVVVLDLCMPELDGLEAARQIHEQFPQTPMLILTGHDPLGLMDLLPGVGVRTCLSKTDLYQLVEAIGSIWQQIRNSSNGSSTTVGKSAADDQKLAKATQSSYDF
jgi:DNA-binding NarL/FixJ family response regulator